MEYSDFFTRIKLWAKEHNITIETLLDEATSGQVTKAVYQGWKKRRNIPSGEFCYKLARYMKVSTDWLISGENSKSDIHIQMLFDKIRKLDARERHAVEQLISNLASDSHFNAPRQ